MRMGTADKHFIDSQSLRKLNYLNYGEPEQGVQCMIAFTINR